MTDIKTSSDDIFERLRRMADETSQFLSLYQEWLRSQKLTKKCEIHNLFQEVNVTEGARQSWLNRKQMLVFKPCPKCLEENKNKERNGCLLRRGVSDHYIRCSFENFYVKNAEDKKNLEAAQKFAKARTGFFVMLSPLNLIGNGKSHLAVSILRESEKGIFITASDLFEKIRFGFSDRARIIELCKKTPLLIIDEFGVTPGYKDEFAIMHDILSTRHNNKRKTVLTGNFANKEEFYEAIGERMKDRLKESGFKLLWFSGESMRPKMKENYLNESD